ncbi:MAG TPA: hypothetical protein PK760_07495, partial [Flavobacteriales bacterium]|nr:hypothetical protein [Flavobacteriales bacterium]
HAHMRNNARGIVSEFDKRITSALHVFKTSRHKQPRITRATTDPSPEPLGRYRVQPVQAFDGACVERARARSPHEHNDDVAHACADGVVSCHGILALQHGSRRGCARPQRPA